ncbi:hypothetical protein AXF42_Ash010316 [Apostasia shenzhenica]|uniref:Syntaxin 6/10/61 N-terminal domain-containing protein n=1 Tax=Apostasia shenzhenica TaxID=1088818 RepID=A0A2I0BDN5_9ASPA|nr:hypothetical protein AXF42_Ash010316 [Apostasia shenzhenica]
MAADGSSVFDQWQKDAFFPAAEKVQESVDSMESVYRMWTRDCVDGFRSDGTAELQRDLQTAMGTAKWQLEELERAISLSYESFTPKDSTVRRHSEFVSAMNNQISLVEQSLNHYLLQKGDELLRWIQLSEAEKDDLANFLSSAPPTRQEARDLGSPAQVRSVPYLNRGIKETERDNKEPNCLAKAADSDCSISENEPLACEELLDARTGEIGLSNLAEWRITVAELQKETEKSVDASDIGNHASMPLRWTRTSCVKAKRGDGLYQSRRGLSSYLNARRMMKAAQGIRYLNDRYQNSLISHREDSWSNNTHRLVGRVSGLERQIQGPPSHWLLSRFLQFGFVLILTFFLIVPFVFYS